MFFCHLVKTAELLGPLPKEIIEDSKCVLTDKNTKCDPGVNSTVCPTAESIPSHVSPKLYSLVEAYLVDVFRQAVNLVGARHREIFSQDHKRCFPSDVYPVKKRG